MTSPWIFSALFMVALTNSAYSLWCYSNFNIRDPDNPLDETTEMECNPADWLEPVDKFVCSKMYAEKWMSGPVKTCLPYSSFNREMVR